MERNAVKQTRRAKTVPIVPDDVLDVVDYELTPELVEEWREAFWLFDRDGDGMITTKEITAVMRNLGQNPTEEDINEMIKEVDIDGSGSIDFEEFLYMMAKKMRDTDSEEELKSAFRVFDRDNDGKLTVDELRTVLETMGGKMSTEEIEEMIREGDIDGSGFIQYDTSFRLWCPSNEKFWDNIAKEYREQKRHKSHGSFISRLSKTISPRKPLKRMRTYLSNSVQRAWSSPGGQPQPNNGVNPKPTLSNAPAAFRASTIDEDDDTDTDNYYDRQVIKFGEVVNIVLKSQQVTAGGDE